MVSDALPASAAVTRRPVLARGLAAVLLLTAAGLALRVLLATRGGLWRDEALFLFIVDLPTVGAMIDFLRFHESHPPLFYLLMRGWVSLFGASDAAALALPLVIGILQVPVAYWVGSRAFSPRAGLIAAILTALSPMLARYAAQVRPYSLMPLLCVLSVYFLWDGAKQGRARTWIAYAVVTLAMLLTHNWGWVVLAAQWALVGALVLMRFRRGAGSLLRGWLPAQAAVLALYAPWFPTLLRQTAHAGHGASPVRTLGALAGSLLESLKFTVALPGLLAVGVVLALVLAAAWRRARRGAAAAPDGDLSLFFFAGVPVAAFFIAAALSARSNLLVPHCLLTLAGCVALALAQGISNLSRSGRGTAALAAAACLSLLYLGYNAALLKRTKSNAREVAAALARASRPTDVVLISPIWLASSFNRYFQEDNPQVVYPEIGRVEAVRWDNLAARIRNPAALPPAKAYLERARREDRRVWLVTDAEYIETNPDPAFALTRELREYLQRLYGNTQADAVSVDGPQTAERLRIWLFTPDGTAP